MTTLYPGYKITVTIQDGGRSGRKNRVKLDFAASSHIGGISDASCSALPDKKMARPEQLQITVITVKKPERVWGSAP